MGKKAKRRQNPLGTHLRSLTVSMSRNRLFLGQVALQQSPPPLHRMIESVKDVWRQNVKDVPALDTLALGDRWDSGPQPQEEAHGLAGSVPANATGSGIGLTLALIVIATTLLLRWKRDSARLVCLPKE